MYHSCIRIFLLAVLVFANSLDGCWALSSSSSSGSTSVTNENPRGPTFPNSIPATSVDVLTLIRQTGQTSPSKAAIGVPSQCQCQHGFAQAFAMDPLPPSGRVLSSLLKLSCPLLVRAIDELEDEGWISKFNKKVATDTALQNAILAAHQIHATARTKMLSPEEMYAVKEKLGERGGSAFLESGVASASLLSFKDVKCLHAWLGDFLFRGSEASPLGALVAQALAEEKGLDLTGTSSCHAFCDPSSTAAVMPPKARNKQRLKTGKELARRKRRRQEGHSERKKNNSE